MKIVHGVKSAVSSHLGLRVSEGSVSRRSVLTVGSFDGVHLSHRALISELVRRARELGVPAIVMTFEPHPVQILHPTRGLKRLFDFEDQRQQLEVSDVDELVIEPFSREFSQLSPERYILDWIVRPFHPKWLVVGHDFAFGADKGGTIDSLVRFGVRFDFQVFVVPPVMIEGAPVSSSRIRRALGEEGDIRFANRLLGRRFYVEGVAEKGAGRGRKIGVPTANLRTSAESVPRVGVYAGIATVRGRTWAAAINIGMNPTFQTNPAAQPTIEAHLIDFDPTSCPNEASSPVDVEPPAQTSDLYGERIRLEFIQRIRDERRFESVTSLVERIQEDICLAREIVHREDRALSPQRGPG